MADSEAELRWTTHDSNLALLNSLSTPTPTTPALPPEIILHILEEPSRWVLNTRVTLTTPYVRHVTGAEEIILRASPLSCPVSRVRKIVFSFRSHDQGWTSSRIHRGTYNHSWTWFDAGLIRNPSNPEQSQTTPRYRLQVNRHASEQYEDYRIELDREHELLKTLRDGDEVVLWACQRFPGWCNFVETATIEIWTLDEIFNLH
ncbi:MAG: hypothetical protein M1816_000267 [Peltula sp. TS41687]|nr:MAG: hypothetical protein M1816_000267 [Peltula sp. TS41687]